jgi:hypothetical protein
MTLERQYAIANIHSALIGGFSSDKFINSDSYERAQ